MDTKHIGLISDQIKQLEKANISPCVCSSQVIIAEGYDTLLQLIPHQMIVCKDPLLISEELSMCHLIALSAFDRALRNAFLETILIAEKRIKTVVSYELVNRFGPYCYLNRDLFIYPHEDDPVQIDELVRRIEQEGRRIAYSEPRFIIEITEYGHFPFNQLVNSISLSTFATMYSLLRNCYKHLISRQFSLEGSELENYLRIFSLFRNVCAHNEHFYSISSRSVELEQVDILRQLFSDEELNKGAGTRDVFALLIALERILGDRGVGDIANLCRKIQSALDSLEFIAGENMRERVLAIMGFPKYWQSVS